MTLLLDGPIDYGRWRIGVLSEGHRSARQVGNGIAATFRKTPAAVVFYDGSDLTAFDMRGRALLPERLEEHCTGLRAAFLDSEPRKPALRGPRDQDT